MVQDLPNQHFYVITQPLFLTSQRPCRYSAQDFLYALKENTKQFHFFMSFLKFSLLPFAKQKSKTPHSHQRPPPFLLLSIEELFETAHTLTFHLLLAISFLPTSAPSFTLTALQYFYYTRVLSQNTALKHCYCS